MVFTRLLVPFDAPVAGVLFEDRRARETKKLSIGEKLFNGLVIVAELRTVALVEDEDDALVAQGLELLLVGGFAILLLLLVALAVFVEREAELLDSGDNDFIGPVIRKQAAHQRFGVGVFLDTAFLKSVEFFARLPVKVFAVHDEQAFGNVIIVLEQG